MLQLLASSLRCARRRAALALLLACLAPSALAADAPPPAAEGGPPRDDSWWRVGAQVTGAGFYLPRFHSPYENPQLSFGPGPSGGWSFVTTLFGGVSPWRGAALVVQPEFADGAGVPNVSGVSGYIDGNIIRVAKVGTEPYVARAFLHQDIALAPAEEGEAEDEGSPEERFMPTGPLALVGARPASRVEITVGKFALTDFFDAASASSDPRHHFMNWSLMTNGAWDFPADTRGYDWGVVVSLEQPRYAVRAAAVMMPSRPNGPAFDGDLLHAHSEVIEGEVRYRFLGAPGAVKLLGYWNHARMGSYADALAAAGPGRAPSITSVEQKGAEKLGLGLLLDQGIGPASAFLRASWNDGRTESFAFTEIDRAVSAGTEIPMLLLHRPGDRLGVGIAVNGLSSDHARYLRAGGQGFQLGDGRLTYAWETVLEAYYRFRIARQLELTADAQGIANPGMNADRGPALAVGARLHAHL